MSEQGANAQKPVAGWRHVLAFFIDLIVGIFGIGGALAAATGAWRENPEGGYSFNLEGGMGALAIGLVIAYFILGGKYGFRIGKLLMRIPKGQ